MQRYLNVETAVLVVAVVLVVWSLGGPAGFFELGRWAAAGDNQAGDNCPAWLFWVRSVWPYSPAPGTRCRWEHSIIDREGDIGPIKTGVYLGPMDLSGWERPQVEKLLDHLAINLSLAPQDASYNSSENKVVPSLNGVRLDTDATLELLFAAPPNTTVTPEFVQLPAEVTREAFPTAMVYHGNPRKAQVSIIINVAWDGEYLTYLRAMLDILDEASVKTTFFVAGEWAENNPELTGEIALRGHELANHGYSDAHPAEQSREQLESEINRTTAAIQRACDQPVVFYSPFYGEYTELVLETAADLGYTVVRWSIDTLDWELPGVEWMTERVSTQLHPGAIILMHPTEQSPRTLRTIIPLIRARKLELVPLTELLSPAWQPNLEGALRSWPGN